MARYLDEHRHWVEGKRVLDFGAGSGIAGIAAAKAGALEVVACDLDPLALHACRANAELNEVELSYSSDFFQGFQPSAVPVPGCAGCPDLAGPGRAPRIPPGQPVPRQPPAFIVMPFTDFRESR
ncbi:Ribosomal protein L11 methyltransferase [compost metagenome]